MTQRYRNLVFEGGGVKGIAYVGALKVLDERGVLADVRRVGGASAGAITATLVALGYTRAELDRELSRADFSSFMDDGTLVGDLLRLWKRFGWHRGDAFQRWMEERIAEKTGDRRTTFAQVASLAQAGRARDLHVVVTNLSTGYSEICSAETTPNVAVADAVRASMAIPFFFTAKSLPPHLYVDGGVLNNYPVKLFDRQRYLDRSDPSATHDEQPGYYQDANLALLTEDAQSDPYAFNRQTLGFRLDSKEEIAVYRDRQPPRPTAVKDVKTFTVQLAKMVMDLQDRRHVHDDDWRRTIYIDTKGVQTTDFSLTAEKKQALTASGEASARTYFAWRDKVGDPWAPPAKK